MKYLIFLIMIIPSLFFAQDTNQKNSKKQITMRKTSSNITSPLTVLTNTVPVAEPPTVGELPPLEMVSSILDSNTTLNDIKAQFSPPKKPYKGDITFYPSSDAWGIWWRFYTQTTSLFNIPAVSEEMLIIEEDGSVLWLQDVKTAHTVQSQSYRALQVSSFDLFGNLFYVFHYMDQDPKSQKVRDKQGFFVRILADKGYMQMSKSPNFEPERSIYWRRFPRQKSKQRIVQENIESESQSDVQ